LTNPPTLVARAAFVTATGVPPAAGTRKIGLARGGAKMITAELPQLPPRPSSASQITCTGPPFAPTRLSLPSAKQPMSRPSRDPPGESPPTVPATSCASVECRDRRQIAQDLLPTLDEEAAAVLQPTNAIRLPSGEISGGPFLPEVSGNSPAGGMTDTSNGG